MAAPINSKTARRANERLQPELSVEKLDSLLTVSKENQLLAWTEALFGHFPISDECVQDILCYFTGGHELFGDPLTPPPVFIRFRCPIGPHFVYQSEVLDQDVFGRPLCPRHRKPMTKVP
jgi:hypothetical protein